MIGQKISPILQDIEKMIWEFESRNSGKPRFTDEGFRASCKIFTTAILDRMFSLQDDEEMEMKDRIKMLEVFTKEFRNLIKIYTNVETQDLYHGFVGNKSHGESQGRA